MQQVYFAECGGRIKIGTSRNVPKRLVQLRTGAGGEVKLIAAIAGDEEIEKALHRKLRPHHIDGEWFTDCREVRAAIQNSLNNFQEVRQTEPARRWANKRFGAVARVIWPEKTAQKLAEIAGTNERSAKRWLAGEFEPPGVVVAAIILEITKRD